VISRFFIDRPIFAAVLSIVIVLGGAVCVFTLPLAQFPKVSPPVVAVTCNYPGASARDVAEAVAAPIEQFVNGVEGMMYMSSSCTNDGSYSLTVTFYPGIDLNMAQVLVQNRVNLATDRLPEVIRQTGVTVRKRSPDPLMGYAIVSKGGRYDQLYLSNYTLRFIRDELLRVPGVSDIFILGQRDYSIRIWVNPNRLAAHNLTAGDVVAAIRDQNNELATGTIGQPPIKGTQDFQITLDTLGRLYTIEQFEQIVIRAMADGRLLRIKDVARVELAAKNQDVSVRFDRNPSAFIVLFQMPDANALETRDLVQTKMAELAEKFPEDLSYDVSFDTTPYTRESISEVFKTLRDAVILVAIVVLLFLQNWRSAMIPLLTVPVAIIGTFTVMAALGFSLNTLTLFGLVLAIGIVVDDAIVVVEAVEHHIENGLNPRDATIKAMQQVSGPVVAVGLVLSAVFIPCAFIGGITGLFFRQFALTIAVSTLISAFNSLTLSPALTALLLRPHHKNRAAPPLPRFAFLAAGAWLAYEFLKPLILVALPEPVPRWFAPVLAITAGVVAGWFIGGPLNWGLSWFFKKFNRGFHQMTTGYVKLIGGMLRLTVVVLIAYGGLLLLTSERFLTTPKGFIPSQDMGYLLISVQLPDSASQERTDEVLEQIEDICMGRPEKMARPGKPARPPTPGIRHLTGISGQSFAVNANGSNFGTAFVNLNDFGDRHEAALYGEAIAQKLRDTFAKEVFDAQVNVFAPPPVRGAGRAGGFAFVIEDRGDLGPHQLQKEVEKLVGTAAERKKDLVGVFSVFRANVPQLKVDVDKDQCLKRNVRVNDVGQMLQVYQGSLYVNDFNLFDRTWQVIVQADARHRVQPEQLKRLKTRNAQGQMVMLGSLADIREVNGPLVLTRYNMYPAATINGGSVPGMSSHQAIDLMQKMADGQLPSGMAYEWTDMSFLELLAGNTAIVIFALAVVMVFLVLAAQYESWSLPMAVILVVPMCLLSAIIGVNIAGKDINIFTQIGFVVLVGLASKNAILIVEFAKKLREGGKDRREATLEACQLRLRPIIMTSLAFILGVLPLILSQGAGKEMRQALGVAVFSGMIGVTLFGILLTPVFFYTIDWLSEGRLFRSSKLRRAGDAVLDWISLGPVRRATAQAWRQRAARRPPVRPIGPIRPIPLSQPEPAKDGNPQAASGNGEPPAQSIITHPPVLEQK
jgi:multidrug efflux pump